MEHWYLRFGLVVTFSLPALPPSHGCFLRFSSGATLQYFDLNPSYFSAPRSLSILYFFICLPEFVGFLLVPWISTISTMKMTSKKGETDILYFLR